MYQAFTRSLLEWFDPSRRPLPWKSTRDPYRIWLSEIILQQTRVEQGMPYYNKFIVSFPTVSDLASAPLDDVLKLWEGLGYYSRARNLHQAAKQVVGQFGGKFPDSYTEILSLKGVGDYTAAAIASFAYDLPHAVVDGNVFRVLSRYFGISTPIDSSAGKKQFMQLAQSLLPLKDGDGALYNQAIMDFGALVCSPRQPLCEECPLNIHCKAYLSEKQDSYPVKAKKTPRRERYFNYLVLVMEGEKTIVRQRGKGDIWNGLFEFPMIETEGPVGEEAFLRILAEREKISLQKIHSPVTFRQDLTHRRIWATFWRIELEQANIEGKTVPIAALPSYAFPKIIRTYLQDFCILGK